MSGTRRSNDPTATVCESTEDDGGDQEREGPLRAERGQVAEQQQERRGEKPQGRRGSTEPIDRGAPGRDRQPARHQDDNRETACPGIGEPARPRSCERSGHRPSDLSAWSDPGRVRTRRNLSRRDTRHDTGHGAPFTQDGPGRPSWSALSGAPPLARQRLHPATPAATIFPPLLAHDATNVVRTELRRYARGARSPPSRRPAPLNRT